MPQQTLLELAAKLIREVDSSSECASEFACDIRIVATALIERETALRVEVPHVCPHCHDDALEEQRKRKYCPNCGKRVTWK